MTRTAAPRRPRLPRLLGLAALLTALSAWPDGGQVPAGDTSAALATISGERLLQHVRVLSSDTFEGRMPASHGEELTVAYLVGEFKRLGLEPADAAGRYLQVVPMSAFKSHADMSYTVHGQRTALKTPDDYIGWSSVRRRHFQIKDSPLVFVGYGVRAPEYQWDDYKGLDLRGKTLVMLINDPPIPDAQRSGELDATMFGGKAMTYYGRWTYKFEEAVRQGAAAAIIVHETGPAAYPYSVVVNSWSGENFSLRNPGPNPDFPAVAGWMTIERARELFASSGQDFDALKARALAREFRPVSLAASVSFDVHNAWREVESHNVVARIPGSDAVRAAETVVYSAHWDHFGWRPQLGGPKSQQVFHGAWDNASGTASLLALAAAFKALPQAPARSVLFIATTGEEQGLLGAAYYAHHPLYPLRDTVADLNMDRINPLGRTGDVEIIGFGQSQLDELAGSLAAAQGRRIAADAHPEKGYYYRADQFEFARAGVPGLYLGTALDYIGQPTGYGEAKAAEFLAQRYHQVGDVIQPDWTLDGGAQDVQLLWQVGYQLANSEAFPQWNPGSEFKARRDLQRAASAGE
jgi:Zn-dependent M28 family amino/carboxypeptidase